MDSKYVPPSFDANAFTCPHCNVHSQQDWNAMKIFGYDFPINVGNFAYCISCEKISIWIDEEMVYPRASTIPTAHPDMPEQCLLEYNEARDVFQNSPRASAAMLRLLIQKLVPILGAESTNLNTAIGELVKKGLPVQIQQALDTCRVIGNETVHPGEIDLNDTPELARSLFNLVNLVIQRMITDPAELEALYNGLPKGKLEGIKDRDKK